MNMKCYKCKQEMSMICDTSWRNHADGSRARATEFMCVECRIWAEIKALDFSQCDLSEDGEE